MEAGDAPEPGRAAMLTSRKPKPMRQAGRASVLSAGAMFVAMLTVLGVSGWLLAGEVGVIGNLTLVMVGLGAAGGIDVDLLMRLKGGERIARWQAPELSETVECLARRAGLPESPTLYRIPCTGINAFAVAGRGRTAVGVSDAALVHLPPRELRAVLAHEISHIISGDAGMMVLTDLIISVTRLAATLTVSVLAAGLATTGSLGVPVVVVAFFLLAPVAVLLLQRALARNREFAADLGAARLTGDPLALASALERLERLNRYWWPHRMAEASGLTLPRLLHTHPPTPERVQRLAAQVHILRPDPMPWPLPPLWYPWLPYQ